MLKTFQKFLEIFFRNMLKNMLNFLKRCRTKFVPIQTELKDVIFIKKRIIGIQSFRRCGQ